MKEIEIKLDASGKPINWDDIMTLDEFTQEIMNPRLEAAKAYAHRFERDAMETALRFGCRAVYIAEWTETHNYKDGARCDMCWKSFPYEFRRDAFRLSKEKLGNIRIIDFKCIVDMAEDEFNAVPSPNKDLAEQIRAQFK